ncbi:MAG: GTP cyclohydrolase I FolE [Helicobacter sp.]|uniref:GTP cyclohydrolase I FolE n=1 Tax=Helicobacter sp. 10-6591 TaxID=2004998 RepID=UPI000DCD1013|nr:GTP cyclohydrolase I FolE [Helicobacter sp. 10-6591]MDD7567545.1 GTP cyclohydrolase I FolE [Helicobacter sp.]MDY5740591.1 GTP cyclohydrolase I FolE [Helicobacter sp.]RAX55015.1 GTP cyclohydrolase I FolE [Helicobacter sp. 10-6591]
MKDSLKYFEFFFQSLCREIGEDSGREGLKETPKRVMESFANLLGGYRQNPKELLGATFKDGVCDEMVIAKGIEFYSMCEHHLLPFFGSIDIGYIPDKYIAGLSSLVRVVEAYAQRLQIQESLTEQIAQCLLEELHPKGVIVVCRARHLCMSMRGVRKNPEIITSALRGLFKSDSKTRAEFMQLVK